jgi:ankyrin repeat protein
MPELAEGDEDFQKELTKFNETMQMAVSTLSEEELTEFQKELLSTMEQEIDRLLEKSEADAYLAALKSANAALAEKEFVMSDAAFIKLCEFGTPEAIERAIEAGANMAAVNEDGDGVLDRAVDYNDDPRAAAVLIEHGADVNARGEDGETPLLTASISEEGAELIAMLLEAGADINAADDDGYTALHYAAYLNDNPEITAQLLDAGADANLGTGFGSTPLMLACREGKVQVINLLLDKGADASIEDEDGEKAADRLPESKPDGVDEDEWQAVAERLRSAGE